MTEENTPVEEVEEVAVVDETIETPEATEETETQEQTEATPEVEETPESKEQARSAYEARQRKKTKQRQTEEENEHLRRQLAQLQQPAPQVQQPEQQKPRDPNAPQMDNFDTVEEYLEARDYHRDNVRARQYEVSKVQGAFDQQMAEYSAKHQTFLDDVDASTVPLSNALAETIKRSSNAPKVLHEIVKDEQLAYKLNNLPPMDLMREVIALENKAEQKQPAISNAPKPITTPSGSPVSTNVDISTMSGAEYRNFMNNKKYQQG